MKTAPILLKKRIFLCGAFTGWLAAAVVAQSAAAEKPNPAALELADQLANAATTDDQARIISSAPPELRGKPLRDALSQREYRLMLQGEYAKAEQLCHLLERLGAEAQDGQAVARSQVLLAAVLREYGDYHGSLAALDRTLSYFDAHPEDTGIVGTYQGKGIDYLDQGDFARALASFSRALDLAEKLKFREGIIPTLNSIGEVYREQGLPERALDFYAKARAVVGNDNAWNMAFIFNNIGQAYQAMGDRAKAAEFIEKARAVADKNKMPPRVATSLAVLAEIARDEQHFDEAAKLFDQSLALARSIRSPAAEGRALLGLADVSRRCGNFDDGLSRANEAIAVLRASGETDQLVAALTTAGRCLRAKGDDAAARHAFEEAIAGVESMRGSVAGAESESEAFFEKRIAPYQEMIALLVDQGAPADALAMAERASARVLLDVMSRGGSIVRENVLTPEEIARERELDRHIAELNRQVSREYSAEQRDEKRLAAVGDALRQARHAREDFDAEMVAAHPELTRAAAPPRIESLDAFAPLLTDNETAVLKFAVTDDRCFAFVLRSDEASGKPRLQVVTLKLSRADLSRRVAAFRSALADRALGWQKPARELYDTVFAPTEELVRGARRLVIAPDGPLWELPFAALLDARSNPLSQNYALSVAPSLSALVEREQRDRAKQAKELVVFANPALGEKPEPLGDASTALIESPWQPLPEMAKQAEALEQLYKPENTRAFIGAAAREEVAKRELPNAGVIEFATHGVLNDRAPLYSYLLLSQQDLAPNEDGLLEARELMRMQLHARLAVLCGCETARGRIGAGEGVIGLSWALLVAGCPSTIVSQWKVDEAATTPLMLELHRQLLAGAPRAEALQRATSELRKDARYRHPFYWAPFVLVGDPR